VTFVLLLVSKIHTEFLLGSEGKKLVSIFATGWEDTNCREGLSEYNEMFCQLHTKLGNNLFGLSKFQGIF
jgi:hypothetical protein